jgi:hypothetical protein
VRPSAKSVNVGVCHSRADGNPAEKPACSAEDNDL